MSIFGRDCIFEVDRIDENEIDFDLLFFHIRDVVFPPLSLSLSIVRFFPRSGNLIDI